MFRETGMIDQGQFASVAVRALVAGQSGKWQGVVGIGSRRKRSSDVLYLLSSRWKLDP